jgi:hypothetical protein
MGGAGWERGWGEVMKVSCMLVKNTNMGKGLVGQATNKNGGKGNAVECGSLEDLF